MSVCNVVHYYPCSVLESDIYYNENRVGAFPCIDIVLDSQMYCMLPGCVTMIVARVPDDHAQAMGPQAGQLSIHSSADVMKMSDL